jgi:energy-coupling factor transporter ATP-binding protein EcfA2
MRITSIHLRNFKRFTDVVIRDIPETAKLVVIIWPNGCGKSSLFDALLQWYRSNTGFGVHGDELYYRKSPDQPFGWTESVTVVLAGGAVPHRGCLYVRTAYRNDPDFAISGINRPNAPSETIRFNRIIDNDQAVSENYQRLVYDTMAAVYNVDNDTKTVAVLREELVGQIRSSMKAVFGDLILNNISDPLGAGAFYFEKGVAKSYHYKNLSGGEKAAFDLLLDLHVKKRFFGDAIYCIDEIETHLHTKIQGTLLQEMVKILPEGSQLWVTTHSLGVLRAAQIMSAEKPGSVSVIDFDGVDPDVPREIIPSNLGRVSWEKLLSIALDDLSQRVAPRVVVICEGSSVGTRRKDFDAEIYNRILGSQTPDILFISGGSANQVAASGVSIRQTLGDILPSARVLAMCDRDDKSPAEVAQFERSGDIVLPLRNLESYLLADDVIEALVVREGKDQLLGEAMKIKANAIASSIARGNAQDDLKSAAGEIYTNLKQLLGLQRCGNTTDTFMRDTLAQLVSAPMKTYEALRVAVIGRIL